ncbi:MAG: glycosyltransferase [Candidatus Shapirobacteria bacterium]
MPKQLRIITLGDFKQYYSWYLAGTIQGSILNGHLHYSVPIRQKPVVIEEQINFFKPHVLFCHMIFSEHLVDAEGKTYERESLHEVLSRARRKWGTKIVYQEGDAKNSPRYSYPITDLIDLGLINSQLNEKYSELMKTKFIHFPYFALYQNEIETPDNIFRTQMSFAGNTSPRKDGHLHSGRYEFIEKLKHKLEMKIYPDKNIGNSKFCTAQLAASSSSVLGIHQGFKIPGYLDTRPWMYCGAGGLYFHDEAPAMDLFFEDKVHYIKYNRFDVGDVYNKYMHYMSENREAGDQIRKEAFRYCQAYHTSKHRIKAVLDVLENGGDRIPGLYLKNIKELGYVPE